MNLPDAYVLKKEWLEIGWDIWKEADENREQIIVLPTDDLEDFSNLSAIPADRAALTRQILSTAGLCSEDIDRLGPWYKALLNTASRF